MITREELLSSKEYWIAKIQIDLFNQVKDYLEEKDINRTQLAEQLGVTKGYISQVLNSDFDHRISKFVELSLAIGKVPVIEFRDIDKIIEDDKKDTQTKKYRKAERSMILEANEQKPAYKKNKSKK
jgi:transcriptional regulator with XRE-family HTH domain